MTLERAWSIIINAHILTEKMRNITGEKHPTKQESELSDFLLEI